MRTRHIAEAFGMTFAQLAKTIGYKRQSLYTGIGATHKSMAAIAKLRGLNATILKVEQEEAQRKFDARAKAVDEFEQLILNGGDES